MELLKKIKDQSPEYNTTYEDLIKKFTVQQGGLDGTASESATWEKAMFFSTKYEIYMYAVLLGLKNDIRVASSQTTKKFWEIKNWQPTEIVDYMIMCILAKSDIDLNALEEKEEKEFTKEISSIKKLIEEYANGGFDKIRSKLAEDPNFFESDNCFIDMLDVELEY